MLLFVLGLLIGAIAGGFLIFLWGRWVLHRLMISLMLAAGTSRGLVRHFYLVDNGVDLNEDQEREVEHRQKVVLEPIDKLIHHPTEVIKEDIKFFKDFK
jgi:hypothetical protein